MSFPDRGKRSLLLAALIGVTAQCTKLPYEPVQILVVELLVPAGELDGAAVVATVDGVVRQALGSDMSSTFEGLGAGTHTLLIEGLTDHCFVEGENPRSIDVLEDAITPATLTVACTPPTSSLAVDVKTTGTDVDPDGYTIWLDGTDSTSIDVNGSVRFEGLSADAHLVELAGIAENCTVNTEDGDNPRTIPLTPGTTASTTFFVHCGPPTGSLVVTTATTGTDVDTTGYTISLDGMISDTVASNGSATFEDLAAGVHTIELSGVAANCDVITDDDANPRTVEVTPGALVATTFVVHCRPPAGALVVDVTTSGTDVDTVGYTISVSGGLSRSVTTNGSITFEGLPAGEYEVELSDFAENCDVVDDVNGNPRNVTVTSGASSTTSFFVHCQPLTGSLLLDVTTVGTDPDTDGYSVSVDDTFVKAIPSNGAVAFDDLPAGEHFVTLEGIADGCRLEGENPRYLSISSGASTRISLTVVCGSTRSGSSGVIVVDVSTSGVGADPDGYAVSLDEAVTSTVPPNGSVTFSSLSTGDHSVAIDGIADNCFLTNGPVSRTVDVPSGGSATESFEIQCQGWITVVTETRGPSPDRDSYTVSVDRERSVEIPTNGQVRVDFTTPGQHSFELLDVAPNCSVVDNPQFAEVRPSGDSQVTFLVTCVASGP